jgi:hypothetical protein
VKEVIDQHLIDVSGQDREKEAVRQFCATRFLLDDLLGMLGVPAGFYWVVLEMPHGCLAEGRVGDIDLLAGPLAWTDPAAITPLVIKSREAHPGAPEYLHSYCAALELAGNGALVWPPPMDYLVAVEAKCAYFDSTRQRVKSLKASKSSIRNLRLQIDELIEVIPCNRVALLDLIVNPPASGLNGQAWLAAANSAVNSFHHMLPTLRGRLPRDSPAGHFAMPWGAVEGGTEAFRGTGRPIALRPSVENPRLCEKVMQRRREHMAARLRQFFSEVPRPLSFPVILDPRETMRPWPMANELSRAASQKSQ